MNAQARAASASATRIRLLEAAVRLFLDKGFSSTSVDEICAAAGTTKGAFFHHFVNKEDVGLAALEHFAYGRLFDMQAGESAWPDDPVERAFAYVEDVARATRSGAHPRGCLIAVLAMELGVTHEIFRARCESFFAVWTDYVRGLFSAALRARGLDETPADGLARCFVSLFEGSVVLARATGDVGVFRENLAYFSVLLGHALTAVPG